MCLKLLGGLRVARTFAMDALAETQLAATLDAPTCALCSRTHPEGAPGRTEGSRFQCRQCLSLQTMLYRNVGSGALRDFSTPERQQFYAKCHEECPGQGYEWKTVRSVLVSRMVTRQLTEAGVGVETESLPLSVWLSRGWEESVVRSCPCHKEQELGGTEVFAVPIRKDWWRETHSRMAEKVLELERAVKRGKDQTSLAGACELEVGAAPEGVSKGGSKGGAKKGEAEDRQDEPEDG